MLLDSLGLQAGVVVDCFAGSGVTGTAARGRGLGFAGIEAHPMMAELATLKVAPTASAEQVRALGAEIVAGLAGLMPNEGALEAETDLVRRSFTGDVLSRLVALRTGVQERAGYPAAAYLKWALLATLRDVAAVKVGWPYQRPGIARQARFSDPVRRFSSRVEMMAADLESITTGRTEHYADALSPSGPPSTHERTTVTPAALTAEVVVGDSRDANAWALLPSGAAACVASPPYLNNFDYADATRLELYFWGQVRTWADMCLHVRSDMVTATTQQATVGEKETSVAVLEGVQEDAAREVLKLVEQIEDARRARGKRSKEYDRVAPAYFVAMRQILANLYAHLEPGASALWLVGDSAPYGVHVDTPRLLGELARGVGFSFDQDVNLRVRGQRWAVNADRHKVGLSERLIVLTRP
ncbi:site-specific DNA-methyltransferase [Cellulosimicrobium funkei]|uniref:site-specific DNA-methyltransferase n=1 Tax=Cellulosimicrobium funkei TaxID=264251 RepID=UPI00203CEC84|nr:site-specific DNA-methyltransferase [Cellulosimicrobium funkei]MCM3535024.1 site-specific DNA-methyltransferase [Cellulosimicrobium funkei]